jgi:penicillin-binding protein 1B
MAQSGRRKPEMRELVRYLLLGVGILGLGLATLDVVHLGAKRGRVLREFELLATNTYYHVLAAPLHVRPGLDARAAGLTARLSRAGLARVRDLPGPGEYRARGSSIVYVPARGHADADRVEIEVSGTVVSSLRQGGVPVDAIDLPPEHLTSFCGSMRERRAPVAYENIPPALVAAALAAEDRRFFEHPGLDWRGIARALVRNMTHRRVVEGGSTITQQAVKIILNRTRRELPAKIDEAVLALFVERRFTKQEILTVYLNNVYLGQEGPFTVHGVAEGARYFFGKPLVELSQKELIELAAAIRAPNAASPRRHRERLEEYTRAIAKAVPDVKVPDPSSWLEAGDEGLVAGDGDASHPTALTAAALAADRLDFQKAQMAYYFDVLEREWRALRDEHRIERPATLVAGVDPVLQLRAALGLQRGLESADERQRRRKSAAELQGAVAALEPQTGRLLAIVGGRDYAVAPFNRAADMNRQVGSTFKPFVYLAALGDLHQDPRITQSSWLPDEPREYQVGRQTWSPVNFDGQFRGWVTVRQALEQSVNAATVALGMDVGVENVAELARTLGVQEQVPENPSMLLGAVETSPIRLAGAYGALANGGRNVAAHTLVEVQLPDGRIVRPDRPAARRVVSSTGAYLVTDMLVGAMHSGTGASAARLGFDHLAAGKTGTSDNARDTWFVGYTPEVVTAVWVGHDDNSPTSLSGSSAALPVWVHTMSAWLGAGWDAQFDLPPGIVFRDIDPLTGDLANSTCIDRETAAFLEDNAPQFYCSLHEPSFGDRLDRMFGPDHADPERGRQDPNQPKKGGWWSRVKDALGV